MSRAVAVSAAGTEKKGGGWGRRGFVASGGGGCSVMWGMKMQAGRERVGAAARGRDFGRKGERGGSKEWVGVRNRFERFPTTLVARMPGRAPQQHIVRVGLSTLPGAQQASSLPVRFRGYRDVPCVRYISPFFFYAESACAVNRPSGRASVILTRGRKRTLPVFQVGGENHSRGLRGRCVCYVRSTDCLCEFRFTTARDSI